jgi:hypothetical protein
MIFQLDKVIKASLFSHSTLAISSIFNLNGDNLAGPVRDLLEQKKTFLCCAQIERTRDQQSQSRPCLTMKFKNFQLQMKIIKMVLGHLLACHSHKPRKKPNLSAQPNPQFESLAHRTRPPLKFSLS